MGKQDILDPRVQVAPQVQVEEQDLQDHRDIPDHQDIQDPVVEPEEAVLQGEPDQLVTQEQQVQPATPDRPDKLVPQVRLVPRVQLGLQVRTIST